MNLYLVYSGPGHQEEPDAYILAPDSETAKKKAVEVVMAEWEKGRPLHERYYREILRYGKRKIPAYEKTNPRPKEEYISVYSPDNVYTVER